MKALFILSFIFVVGSAEAKEINDFNHVLIQDVRKDIQNNNDQTFRTKEASRGPASVEADKEGTQIEETQKIEKSNFRQIGPNKW